MKKAITMNDIFSAVYSDGRHLWEATLPEIYANQGDSRAIIRPVIWASCIEPGKLFAVDFIGKQSGVRLGTYPTAKEAQEAANAYGRMKCTDFAAMICRKEA